MACLQSTALNSFCALCGSHEDGSKEVHKSTSKHRFNSAVANFRNQKSILLKNSSFIDIDLKLITMGMSKSCVNEKGSFKMQLTTDEFLNTDKELTFEYILKNESNSTLVMEKYLLVDSNNFSFSQKTACGENFRKDETCSFKVVFKSETPLIGTYKMPILLKFYQKTNGKFVGLAYRQLKIEIVDNESHEIEIYDTPFLKQIWNDVTIINSTKNNMKKLDKYSIPEGCLRIFMNNLNSFENASVAEIIYRIAIKQVLQQGLSLENYSAYFETLLWLDEANTKNSLIFLNILQKFPQAELDVSFTHNRFQYERMHLGVHLCNVNYLFPECPATDLVDVYDETKEIEIFKEDLFNGAIFNNENQLIAVKSILNNVSREAPYIIFGPPGTGKTITVVEAILQIKNHFPRKRILVCAPANFACDMVTKRLSQHCNKSELLRIHAGTRPMSEIEPNLRRFSNIECEELVKYDAEELMKYKIVVSTLHHIGKFFENYVPDVIFIDEAGQATEPESNIALALLDPGKQIILAGDPKQLGPVVSQGCLQTGLAKSFMERLMEGNNLYQPISREPLVYNNDYISMLTMNYRSHEHIIHVPNELFYENSLKCCSSIDELSSKSISALVFKQNPQIGTSVEFCGVLSKDEKNGFSPSYFNNMEIRMVVNYVQCLLKLNDVKVLQSDIGIIAPYIRQVQKIRKRLQELKFEDVQVGTTESFQGQEKRVMIISTVRSRDNLFYYDRKYNLGFVDNEKRFNVAVTRAKAKLIVVGNPYNLGYNNCWLKLINYCQELNSYHGVQYLPRNDEYREKILGLLQ